MTRKPARRLLDWIGGDAPDRDPHAAWAYGRGQLLVKVVCGLCGGREIGSAWDLELFGLWYGNDQPQQIRRFTRFEIQMAALDPTLVPPGMTQGEKDHHLWAWCPKHRRMFVFPRPQLMALLDVAVRTKRVQRLVVTAQNPGTEYFDEAPEDFASIEDLSVEFSLLAREQKSHKNL